MQTLDKCYEISVHRIIFGLLNSCHIVYRFVFTKSRQKSQYIIVYCMWKWAILITIVFKLNVDNNERLPQTFIFATRIAIKCANWCTISKYQCNKMKNILFKLFLFFKWIMRVKINCKIILWLVIPKKFNFLIANES